MASAPQSATSGVAAPLWLLAQKSSSLVLSHTPTSPIRVDGILLQVDRTNRELLLKWQTNHF
jgi:hypothetical protein